MRRGGLIAMIVSALIVGLMPAALARGGVTEDEKVTTTVGPAVHSGWTEECGVSVTVSGTISSHFRTFEDGSMKNNFRSYFVYESAYGSLTLKRVSNIDFEPEQVVDNGDGTHTVLIPHRETGMARLQAPGERPLTVDAGWIDWLLIIDSDGHHGHGHHEEILGTSGPHPLLEATHEELADYYCGTLAG